jgi:uncharacterized membrane protein YdbT with pleckstrin-like domain
MSYISRRLAPGEEILHEGRFHWVQKAWPWVALLVLGIIFVGVFIWIAELVRMNTTRMVVTSRRVILKRGFLSIKVDELTLASVEGAHVEQSIFGRMFGYGKLQIRGRGETHLQFPTMDRPGQFRAAIEDARIRGENVPIGAAPRATTETTRVETAPLKETKRERKLRLKEELRAAEWRVRHAN